MKRAVLCVTLLLSACFTQTLERAIEPRGYRALSPSSVSVIRSGTEILHVRVVYPDETAVSASVSIGNGRPPFLELGLSSEPTARTLDRDGAIDTAANRPDDLSVRIVQGDGGLRTLVVKDKDGVVLMRAQVAKLEFREHGAWRQAFWIFSPITVLLDVVTLPLQLLLGLPCVEE